MFEFLTVGRHKEQSALFGWLFFFFYTHCSIVYFEQSVRSG
jgi:hypothetical protein